jgi:hypothetical protein
MMLAAELLVRLCVAIPIPGAAIAFLDTPATPSVAWHSPGK